MVRGLGNAHDKILRWQSYVASILLFSSPLTLLFVTQVLSRENDRLSKKLEELERLVVHHRLKNYFD